MPPSVVSVALMKKVMSNSHILDNVNAFGKNDREKDKAVKPKQILSNISANRKKKSETSVLHDKNANNSLAVYKNKNKKEKGKSDRVTLEYESLFLLVIHHIMQNLC